MADGIALFTIFRLMLLPMYVHSHINNINLIHFYCVLYVFILARSAGTCDEVLTGTS